MSKSICWHLKTSFLTKDEILAKKMLNTLKTLRHYIILFKFVIIIILACVLDVLFRCPPMSQ